MIIVKDIPGALYYLMLSLGRLDRFGIGPKLETSISSLMTTELR